MNENLMDIDFKMNEERNVLRKRGSSSSVVKGDIQW